MKSPTTADLPIVLRRIRDAWIHGQPIVPIIGAGFSVHSGYPILNSICRYLARFLYALDNNLLIPNLGATAPMGFRIADEVKALLEKAKDEPIYFIEKFGWPDRFELTERVARHVLNSGPSDIARYNPTNAAWTNHELLEEAITRYFSRLAKQSCSRRAAGCWQRLNQPLDKLDTGERTAANVSWDRWSIQGDWRRLVQWFAGYRADYADALFARFGFLRNPGQGHRYLSFLVRMLSVRHIFTFNFDNLIEDSLAMEGIPYRIYGMEHGRALPSPGVLDEGLSVIKMHGSHHSILIDETLDRPLDSAYVDRFYDLAGSNALILVLGCSGDDRRLEDLLTARIDRRKNRAAQVCWLHFERESPLSTRTQEGGLDSDIEAMTSSLMECPTNSPAAFVRHLVFYISGRFPASTEPYQSHPAVPTTLRKPQADRLNAVRATSWPFSYESKLDVGSSEELLELATGCANENFVVIWIDVEGIHTTAGLVGAIIDGCRRVDPELPPAVMPLDDERDQSRNIALSRLEHALQRQRYAVIVDAIGNYGSSPLMHHSKSRSQEHEDNMQSPLQELLTDLSKRQLGQSIVIASAEGKVGRRWDDTRDIMEDTGRLLTKPEGAAGSPLLWTCLATFRRTRAMPAIRRLLSTLIDPTFNDEAADDFLQVEAKREHSPIRLLEGGDIWFVRSERDRIYVHATRFTSSNAFRTLSRKHSEHVGLNALFQSILMAFLHKTIASTYFSFEFIQSKDASSFLEYTYHRISSIRYFSRAIYILSRKRAGLQGVKRLFASEISWPEGGEGNLCGYFGASWSEVFKAKSSPSFCGLLRRRRALELQALLASWQEFEQTVRSQVSAEQLLHWIREILDSNDGLQRMAGIYIADEKEFGDQGKVRDDDDKESQRMCNHLHGYFSRLRLQISLERGDFATAKSLASDAIPNRRGALGRTLHSAQLDLIEVLARTEAMGDRRQAGKLLGQFNIADLQREERLRYHHMQALVGLGGNSGMSVSGEGDSTLNLTHALRHANAGIEQVRATRSLIADPLSGMIVSAGSTGGAYCPYRSVFRTLKGRAIMAQMLASPPEVQTLKCDITMFRRIMRQFDQAKGGLGRQYTLLHGWADLHAAESALFLVRRTFDRESESLEERLCVIEAKLLACRSHLDSAIRALRAGRRNALWWRHCSRLTCQYHVERLFLDLYKLALIAERVAVASGDGTRVQANKERINVGLDLLKRHGRSLEALAAFRDYSLNASNTENDPWFRRTYAEIQLGASAAITFGQLPKKDINASMLVLFVKDLINYSDDLRARSFSSLRNHVINIAERLARTPEIAGDTVSVMCEEWRRRIVREAKPVM